MFSARLFIEQTPFLQQSPVHNEALFAQCKLRNDLQEIWAGQWGDAAYCGMTTRSVVVGHVCRLFAIDRQMARWICDYVFCIGKGRQKLESCHPPVNHF